MKGVRNYTPNIYRESIKRAAQAVVKPYPEAAVQQMTEKALKQEDDNGWPRRIFSGIQPTGSLHLGNYLGALKKWVALQNGKENLTYCIVDMHSITVPQNPQCLRENILEIAATLLACGIDPVKANIFVQSAVKEHAELCWILSCLSTMARLSHLPQYKEKSLQMKEIPMGLFAYPVLQAADIMLYKSTHVPVGEDQVQHIQLAQHLARIFNTRFGPTFPTCHAIVDNKHAARIRSLRNPTKKMSKSDADRLAAVFLTDEPDIIVEKFKKAVTDFTSDVTYDPDMRLGVSNLITIHSLVTGQSIKEICEEAYTIDTGMYKMRVADAVVEHLKPVRCKIKEHLSKRRELIYLLQMGSEKARQVAQHTMAEVREKLGLGTENYRVNPEIILNLNLPIHSAKQQSAVEDKKPGSITNVSPLVKVIENKNRKKSSKEGGSVKQPEKVKI